MKKFEEMTVKEIKEVFEKLYKGTIRAVWVTYPDGTEDKWLPCDIQQAADIDEFECHGPWSLENWLEAVALEISATASDLYWEG